VQYTVGGSAQTAFTVTFKFFAEGDLVVYDGNTELSYALSPSDATEYSVSGVGEASGGTVTLGGSGVTNTTITIVRDVPVARSTDFPASGPFQIDSLNDELDKFAAMIAERENQIDRTLIAPDTDPTSVNMTLPAKADRLGKYLQFNSTTGLPEAGPNSEDVTTLADVASDIATLADIEDGTDATDAIQTVAGISSNVSTVAGVAANVTTVAGVSADVTTVAGISADVTVAATNVVDITNFADVYIGPSASDPTQRADTSALQAGDLYFNTTSNALKVYTGSAWVETALVAADFLQTANNLSDLGNAATARTNLGVAIGSDVQAYDADNAVTDAAQTFTVSQRGTITTDNDLSLDQNATNNFKCTPTGTGTLTFTNHTAGQSGNILLDNSGGHAISLAATTKGDANLATTISAAGTYWLSYYDDGTNAYVVTSAVFA
jgi:hypothetical protein